LIKSEILNVGRSAAQPKQDVLRISSSRWLAANIGASVAFPPRKPYLCGPDYQTNPS